MGFECGFTSTRIDKDTNTYFPLLYLGNIGDKIDYFIYSHGSLSGEIITLENGDIIPNEGYSYLINKESLKYMSDITDLLYRTLYKYSERIISEYSDYFSGYTEEKPKDMIKKQDFSIIKDEIYKLDWDLENLWKIYRFVTAIHNICNLDHELLSYGVLYYRSW